MIHAVDFNLCSLFSHWNNQYVSRRTIERAWSERREEHGSVAAASSSSGYAPSLTAVWRRQSGFMEMFLSSPLLGLASLSHRAAFHLLLQTAAVEQHLNISCGVYTAHLRSNQKHTAVKGFNSMSSDSRKYVLSVVISKRLPPHRYGNFWAEINIHILLCQRNKETLCIKRKKWTF